MLNAAGWRPSGMRNYGTLIEPPQDLTSARFMLDDGKPLAWKDDEWSWTLIALTGPGCAQKCLARIDELRRARLTLNQNAYRVRVVVLDDTLPARAIAPLKPTQRARDTDGEAARDCAHDGRRCGSRARRSARIPDPELSGRATTPICCARISRG